MKTMMQKILMGAAVLVMLTGAKCASDADTASKNLSTAADAFEVQRRIVFYNGITGEYILTLEGRCSLGNFDSAGQLTVTCRTGEDAFKKHFLGLSDNVTFFAEQLEDIDVSIYHNRIIFKPQSIIPNIDFRGDAGELLDAITPDSDDG